MVGAAAVERNADRAQALFDQVAEKDPARALDLLARLSEFALPKLARTEMTLEGEVVSTEVQIHRVQFVNADGTERPRRVNGEAVPSGVRDR